MHTPRVVIGVFIFEPSLDMAARPMPPAGAAAPGFRKSLRVSILHPDLGIGGAERLIVDAAVELTRLGHTVVVYTTFHDPKRCFDETKDGA